MTLRSVSALLLVLTCAPATARAQGDDEAGRWIEEGIRLRGERRDLDALALFRRAWERTRSAEARAQMALAQQAAGQWIEAEADLLAALAPPADPWIVRHRAPLDMALREIRQHLARVEVRCETPGARVRINAGAPEALPLDGPRRVVIGTVQLELSAEGFVTARRALEVRPDDDLVERFTLVPVAPSPAWVATSVPPAAAVSAPRPAPPREPPASTTRAWSVRLLAIGGGFVAVGLAGAVWRELVAQDFNAPRSVPCELDPTTPGGVAGGASCASLREQSNIATGLALAGLITGGVAAVTGVGLLLAAPSSRRAEAVTCAPGPASLRCVWRF